ncbi:hypothetical protein [Pseudomonas moorei]|uniref:DUF2188 domain-containing protein n=1 Tax=Pseudomonas moorei TaxID=395599 RepID=A0A1H1FJM8_9PSED|nr:hypothetical protein [Pseudomonas moorei]KAB0509660.1 hypothetical protein F7R06_01165 [Pseudomonas moorei]SDR01080.1 hypothetical protein SAMN04490195_2738 [Pseudomonas moorei]
MNWKAISKHCLSSEEGYLLSKYKLEHGHAYVARTPAGKILHSGKDLDKAKAACIDHFESTQGKAA